jgi:hypothetical protein
MNIVSSQRFQRCLTKHRKCSIIPFNWDRSEALYVTGRFAQVFRHKLRDQIYLTYHEQLRRKLQDEHIINHLNLSSNYIYQQL